MSLPNAERLGNLSGSYFVGLLLSCWKKERRWVVDEPDLRFSLFEISSLANDRLLWDTLPQKSINFLINALDS